MLRSKPAFEIFTYVPQVPLLEEEVRLHTNSAWSHAGAPLDPRALPPSYHVWARETFLSGDILNNLRHFLDFLHQFLLKKRLTHYCLTIRAQKRSSQFDIPRWHVDRRFFGADFPDEKFVGERTEKWGRYESGKPSNLKLSTTLAGPGTIFLKDGEKGMQLRKEIEKNIRRKRRKKGQHDADEDHLCASFCCLGCADMALNVRNELAAEVKKRGMETVPVGNGECAVWRVDGYSAKNGPPAMHTEPVMNRSDRVYVHVVPGREGELCRLVQGWGMDFPRDWSVGVFRDFAS